MSNRRKIDLDAARRAQAELTPTEPPAVVILGGKEFELPPKLPGRVPVCLAYVRRGRLEYLTDVFAMLFGDRVDEAMAIGLEISDIDAIIEGAYGDGDGEEEELPESPGSAT